MGGRGGCLFLYFLFRDSLSLSFPIKLNLVKGGERMENGARGRFFFLFWYLGRWGRKRRQKNNPRAFSSPNLKGLTRHAKRNFLASSSSHALPHVAAEYSKRKKILWKNSFVCRNRPPASFPLQKASENVQLLSELGEGLRNTLQKF